MSDPEMGVPEQPGPPPTPLGEVLQSRGLITAEQLERALADQRESRRPLGEILVRLGFARGPVIAQALATQQGRILKSEYGFATGFDAMLFSTSGDSPPPVTTRTESAAAAGGLRLVPQAHVADESGAADPLPQADAMPQPHPSEVSELRATIAELSAAVDEAVRERDAAATQLRAAGESNETLRRELERLAGAEADARLIAAELTRVIGERDAALSEARTLPAESPVDAPEQAGHLLFFPAGGLGYALVERAGPPPSVGDILDVSADGGPSAASVTKVAAPPVPGGTFRCAYLL
jgi:hypothetical protein